MRALAFDAGTERSEEGNGPMEEPDATVGRWGGLVRPLPRPRDCCSSTTFANRIDMILCRLATTTQLSGKDNSAGKVTR